MKVRMQRGTHHMHGENVPVLEVWFCDMPGQYATMVATVVLPSDCNIVTFMRQDGEEVEFPE